jgi:hypothetical protein
LQDGVDTAEDDLGLDRVGAERGSHVLHEAIARPGQEEPAALRRARGDSVWLPDPASSAGTSSRHLGRRCSAARRSLG